MGKGGQVVGREGGLIRDGQSHQLRFASLATLSQGEWPVRVKKRPLAQCWYVSFRQVRTSSAKIFRC